MWDDYKLPDLVVDDRLTAVDPTEHEETFAENHCAVLEGCVVPGQRRLLRFNTRINNMGSGDLVRSLLSCPRFPSLRLVCVCASV